MPDFHVDPKDPTPIYAQLERRVRSAIAGGTLAPGTQMPTVRQMAVDLSVNANTVAKVYAQLERDGFLETRRGVGTFVRAGDAPVGAKAGRERELRQLARRYLDDGAALGFKFNELVKQLHQERR
jgi:GntR family transcriptional regulator